jgi:hypothetical protein
MYRPNELTYGVHDRDGILERESHDFTQEVDLFATPHGGDCVLLVTVEASFSDSII